MRNQQPLPPDKALELQLKKHPDDLDTKVDVGSDYSMDASDPSSATAPGNCNEPVPSSGFPESEPRKTVLSQIKRFFRLGE